MNRQLLLAIGLVSGLSYVVGLAAQPQPKAASSVCGSSSAAQVRTTLYFGTTKPTGAVSQLEWQMFLRDEVTQRFPEGLTVWDAQGQWKSANGQIAQEAAKVLLVVHPDTAKARLGIQELIGRYRQMFQQESVMWETSSVCISF